MTLYEINAQINAILENGYYLDEETGEWKGEDDLEQLEIDKNEKIENIALFIKNETALINDMSLEESSLAERRKSHEAKVERLKSYLYEATGGTPFESAKASITFRKSEKVEVDPERLPKEWFTEKVSYNPNKTAIKNAIKGGANIEGAVLVENHNTIVK